MNVSPSVVTLTYCAAACAIFAQTLPQGFTDMLVARVQAPTAMAFLPDGRILATTQTGVVRLIENDQLVAEPVLTIPTGSICSNSERGLLGIAVDLQFNSNSFVYLFYTYRGPGRDCSTRSATTPVNRVSRFVMGSNGKIDLATETVLLDNIASYAGNHNAGDLKFDRNGNLFVATGDAGCYYGGGNRCASGNPAARERHTLLGKVLRIDRDGNIPNGNPWAAMQGAVRCNQGSGQPGQLCAETWMWGFRNPFRIAIHPVTGAVMVNDVGQDTWEEIDPEFVGGDFGWNDREGFCATGSTTNCSTGETFGATRNPVFAYQHNATVPGTQSSGCNSLSGGAFVPENNWPTGFDGYYFADFVCGSIFHLINPRFSDRRVEELARGVGNVTTLAFGPYRNIEAMYYLTYARGGELRRIVGFTATSAASYKPSVLAPDSLASLFGTSLSDATLRLRDSSGTDRNLDTFFTSETQANFLIPAATTLGSATLTVRRGTDTVAQTQVTIERTQPAMFTANGTGTGVAAATAIRVVQGSVTPVPVFECPQGIGSCVTVPIDVTQGDVYVSLYGTGIRGSTQVVVTAASIPLVVQYAGPQSQYAGLDQVNVRLPASLAGRGEVPLVVSSGDEVSPIAVIQIQ